MNNKENITIVSAEIIDEKKFILVHSDDLTNLEIPHAYIFELQGDKWTTFKKYDDDLRHISSKGSCLYLNSLTSIYKCSLNDPDAGKEIRLRDDVELINRINNKSNDLIVLCGNGNAFFIDDNQMAKPFIDDSSLDSILMDYQPISDGNGYLVGMDGLCGFYNSSNAKWDLKEIGTNKHLTGVTFWNGSIYICGFDGLFINGINDEWDIRKTNFEEYDFWAITVFKNRLFVLTENIVLELGLNKELSPVYFLEREEEAIFHTFRQNKDLLWVVGEKDLIEFDGINWSILLEV